MPPPQFSCTYHPISCMEPVFGRGAAATPSGAATAAKTSRNTTAATKTSNTAATISLQGLQGHARKRRSL
uniref:Uncharacterized protein n=1 Tax=Fagus sylvatica TaxID=28930 RepID=A0A2N9J172_FAGSY